MALGMGSRVGPYEIVGTLGAGGMGVVFRAKDTRLGRVVALKVLPDDVKGDEGRLKRFELEATATSALNHPNILAIHDVGTHEGTPYVVAELLEGETLREALARGPVPVRKTIEYAAQLAHGLAAAHEKGIIHRDIKPENLFVTRDGRLKILDFGLAREVGPVASDTLSNTASGAVLGTAGYMSPEQVRGAPADARSDIFALGVVVYELLSGQRAFGGTSGVERGYATLNADPPELSASGVKAPPAVERIVRRCLEKEPAQRFQSARDVAFALEALSSDSGAGVLAPLPSRPKRARLGALAALVLVAGLGGGYLLRARTDVAPVAAAHFAKVNYRRGWILNGRFAPDGRSVVYAGTFGRASQVYLAEPGLAEARAISDPNVRLLAVSAKGELALGINRDGNQTLARAPLAGGAPREVLENFAQADWGPNGELLVVRRREGKTRIEYPLNTVLLEADGFVDAARVSPQGNAVAFVSNPMRGDMRGTVELVRTDGTHRTLSGPWWALAGIAWSPDGKEVWFSAANAHELPVLHAVSVDGVERRVLEGPGGLALLDIAPDGRVLIAHRDYLVRIEARLPGSDQLVDLSWLDGSVLADVSMDGSKVLFTEESAAVPDDTAYLRSTDGSPAVQLGPGRAYALSPDARWAIVSPKAPFTQLAVIPTGPGESRALPGDFAAVDSVRWFPDGRRILIDGAAPGRPDRLWIQDLDGGAPWPVTEERVSGGARPPSPNGELLLASGPDGVGLIVPVDGGAPRALPGLEGKSPIQWSADGTALWATEPRAAAPPYSIRIDRYELATAATTPWRELWPVDRTTPFCRETNITRDGQTIVYRCRRMQSDLFVVTGLR